MHVLSTALIPFLLFCIIVVGLFLTVKVRRNRQYPEPQPYDTCFQYAPTGRFLETEGYQCIYKIFKLNGKLGIFSYNYEVLAPAQYDSVAVFNTAAAVGVFKGNEMWLFAGGNKTMFYCGQKTVKRVFFIDAFGYVILDSAGKLGLFDGVGRQYTACIYGEIENVLCSRLFKVRLKDSWYLLSQGDLTLHAGPFAEIGHVESFGRILVRNRAGRWGYVDSTGRQVIAFRFSKAEDFKDSVAVVSSGAAIKYINVNGEIAPGISKEGFSFGGGSLLLDDASYNSISRCIFCNKFSEGLAAVFDHSYRVRCYIDTSGTVFLADFDEVGYFSDGLALVGKGGYRGKWGYGDRTGKLVIPVIFDSAQDFMDGHARVSFFGQGGYVDKTGKLFLPQNLRDSLLSLDTLPVGLRNLSILDINDRGVGNSGNTDTSRPESNFEPPRDFRRSPIRKALIRDLILEHSNATYPGSTYTYGIKGEDGSVSLIPRSSCIYGLIDDRGNVIVKPKYDEMGDFSKEGLVKVRLYGKYGYIDPDGDVVVPFIYDDATDFACGRAIVRLGKYYRIIDKNNKCIKVFDH